MPLPACCGFALTSSTTEFILIGLARCSTTIAFIVIAATVVVLIVANPVAYPGREGTFLRARAAGNRGFGGGRGGHRGGGRGGHRGALKVWILRIHTLASCAELILICSLVFSTAVAVIPPTTTVVVVVVADVVS